MIFRGGSHNAAALVDDQGAGTACANIYSENVSVRQNELDSGVCEAGRVLTSEWAEISGERLRAGEIPALQSNGSIKSALHQLDTVGRKMGVFFTVYVNGDV